MTGLLVLVSGLCAAGRSTVLDILLALVGGRLFVKESTRQLRRFDRDILAVSMAEFARKKERGEFLTYECGGHEYGIDLLCLDDQLLRCGRGALIVSDFDAISSLRSLYPSVVMPSWFVWSSPLTMERRLREAGHTDEEIYARMVRSAPILAAFREHPEVYDAVIINEFDRDVLERQVGAVAAHWIARAAKDA